MGFIPVTPQWAAGWRILPPVSEAMAYHTCPAATAAAAPPEDPPAARPVSQGLRTLPYQEVSEVEPMANSSMFSLPMLTAPAAESRSTAVAS